MLIGFFFLDHDSFTIRDVVHFFLLIISFYWLSLFFWKLLFPMSALWIYFGHQSPLVLFQHCVYLLRFVWTIYIPAVLSPLQLSKIFFLSACYCPFLRDVYGKLSVRFLIASDVIYFQLTVLCFSVTFIHYRSYLVVFISMVFVFQSF